MASSTEQRVAIKFCFKAGKTATETVEMVHAAYGDEALTRSNIFCWYGRFCEGRKDIQCDPRNGGPSDSRTDGNIEKVWQLLLQNCHLSLQMIADEPDISKDTVQKIVVEDMKKKNKNGSCCTIMLLPTTQLSSSSFSQRKALLFFTTPLLARVGTC
jgi:hypothetical protein